MRTNTTKAIITTTIAAIAACSANADVIFQDNFESGLGQWTGKNNRAHHGKLVIDPFNNENTVLTFSKKISAGDMFANQILTLDPDETYNISFDYLGLAKNHTRPGDTGGYVGFSVGTPSRHSWQWATGSVSGAKDVLIDDGQWHSYNFEFTAADLAIGNSVRLMLEDFSGSRGTHGDAYFDNFTVAPATIPAQGTFALLTLGGLLTTRRRRI